MNDGLIEYVDVLAKLEYFVSSGPFSMQGMRIYVLKIETIISIASGDSNQSYTSLLGKYISYINLFIRLPNHHSIQPNRPH